MIKEAHTNSLQSSDLCEKDQVVIQDRPSVYSVEEAPPAQKPANDSSSPSLRELLASSAASDDRSMIEKLRNEISHLEKWLSHQKGARKKSSLSVTNTIRVLISTRQSLLETLERRLK